METTLPAPPVGVGASAAPLCLSGEVGPALPGCALSRSLISQGDAPSPRLPSEPARPSPAPWPCRRQEQAAGALAARGCGGAGGHTGRQPGQVLRVQPESSGGAPCRGGHRQRPILPSFPGLQKPLSTSEWGMGSPWGVPGLRWGVGRSRGGGVSTHSDLEGGGPSPAVQPEGAGSFPSSPPSWSTSRLSWGSGCSHLAQHHRWGAGQSGAEALKNSGQDQTRLPGGGADGVAPRPQAGHLLPPPEAWTAGPWQAFPLQGSENRSELKGTRKPQATSLRYPLPH